MTLFARVGSALARLIAARMIRCPRHGWQAEVLACPCAVSGERELGASSMDGVFCIEHLRGFEEDDPAADDDLEPRCFQCLAEQGLLLVGSEHASPAAAPAAATAPDR